MIRISIRDPNKQPTACKKKKKNRVLCLCISVFGVTLWNGPEEEIKQSENTGQFKNKYEQYIFDGY